MRAVLLIFYTGEFDMRKLISLFLAFAIVISTCLAVGTYTLSAGKMKLNKTKVTLKVGESFKLVVKNNKKSVKWKSSSKKVAAVNKKGKVKAKRLGKAKIYAKVGSKKLTCRVKVEGRITSPDIVSTSAPAVVTESPAKVPGSTDMPAVTKAPQTTENPDATHEPDSTVEPEVTETPDNPSETQTPEMTREPQATNNPTDEPTKAPTDAPTKAPTIEPTRVPTQTPDPDSLGSAPTEDPNHKDDGWVPGWY